MSDNILILGATSGIARALARVLAQRGCRLILAARDQEQLERLATDLRVRYQSDVVTEPFEALDFAAHPALIARCFGHFPDGLYGVVLCHGYLPDQSHAEMSFYEAQRTVDLNYTSAVSLLHEAACHLASQKRGFLAAVSSVAGDRGRRSNYVYGSSKAALTTFLQGLRNRLYPSGVRVITIKPGFVQTRMTEGRVNPRSPLLARPERVARDIDRAIRRGRDVIYTPWYWRYILLVIRMIPESVFKRMKL